MGKAITYTRRAVRALRRMPANEADRVIEKIEQYAESPEELANNVIKLQGRSELRLRVGDWRVLFEETDDTVNVLDVGARGDIY